MGERNPKSGARLARGAAIAGPLGLGLAIALLVPSAANAAGVVSQGNGQLISATVAGTHILDTVAALNGASAVNTDGTSTVTSDTPLDPSAIADLVNVPVSGVNLFGDNGIIQLGAVGQYAQANPDGSSVAFSGAVSQAPSLVGVGTSVTPSNLGTPAGDSNAEVKIGDPNTAPASIDVQWGLLAASAKQTADGTQTGTYTLEAKQIQVGGTVIGTALAPISAALNTVLGVASGLGINIANPIAGNTVTLTMDDILAVAGVSSINDLPPGTDLVQYLPQAVANKVTSMVNTTLSSLSTAASGLGLVGLPLTAAISTANATITPLLSGLNTTLVTPLGAALSQLAQLKVNNQTTNPDGSFTETALRVGVGPNSSLASVDLASATVGPNAGLAAVPLVNPRSAGIAALLVLAGLGAWAAIAYRRRTHRLAVSQ